MIVEVKIVTTGQRIKSAREQASMTQIELANKLNISYQSIGQWERDVRTPKQSTLIKIAKALGVHLRDLADTSIWEEFDKQYPDMGENVARFGAVTAYLKEMGFSVDFTPENEEGESYTAELGKDGHQAKFTQSEFEELQAGAKEAIEGRFYKKVLEQQKKK